MHVFTVFECLECLWERPKFDQEIYRVCLSATVGLWFQLGHVTGQFCPFVQRGPNDFVVIASNGIHTLNVDFCGCPGQPEFYAQLLEMQWWPSTPLAPQTASTIEVLRTFHVLNLQARIPPTEFYRGLERMMDGQGLMALPVSCSQSLI
jgi:hypothetical protein